MCTPEKSSDEILKELFGLCQQKQICPSKESSDDISEDSDSHSSSQQKRHKHKKKKKKHKKLRKRRRSLSADSHNSDGKSRKEKKKKVKKEPNVEDTNAVDFVNVEWKIKKEKDAIENSDHKSSNGQALLNNDESDTGNYMDALTGKPITLDDVFTTLGIVTRREIAAKIKQEKELDLLRPDQIKKENIDDAKVPKQTDKETKVKCEPQKEGESIDDSDTSKKYMICEVFDDGKTETNDPGSKKISIPNLKNSVVYEATMKEIEERERQKAEKYEEGELSSSFSSSSDLYSFDHDMKKVSGEEEDLDTNKSRESGKRPQSSEETKRTHRSHSHKKKHHRHKEDREQCESRKKLRSSDRSRHKSRSSRSRSHHRHHRRSRSLSFGSRSTSVPRRPHRSRNRRHEWGRDRSRSRSPNRTMSKQRKSKSKSVERIDKQKLLEIARKNAINLLQQGALPSSVIVNKNKIATIKAGGKTVDELTDFCKQLSKKEAEGPGSGDSSDNNGDSDDEKSRPFHHPFQLKERPANIVMNIRNAVPLPIKTAQEKTLELSKQLSLQYPVSSGQQHRKSENVWIPVEKTKENAVLPQSNSFTSTVQINCNTNVTYPVQQAITYPLPMAYPQPAPVENSSLVPAPPSNIDISSIVAQRLEAIRRLSENPCDPIGTNLIQAADSKMTVWAESKVQPGLFTGSTGVKPLSVAELASGYKAWPKKNQFTAAKPVCSDRGEALMKKMGWQPGEGLGKYKQGPSAPCEVSMKTDRKGLAEQPIAKTFKQSDNLQKAFEITQSKHPVSLLNEFCSRKKIGVPQYDCEEREGVGRRKLFLFSVTVQGGRYTPKVPSTNKKQSKMEAATVCLQTLGLLPIIPPSD